MPRSTKPGWVDWKTCPAREVIMEDLRPGGALYQRDNITAEEIFPWYKQLPAFEDVVLDQFKACLKSHRDAANKETHRSCQEHAYFEHDRAHYPRRTHNTKSELIFDTAPAKLLLRKDLRNGVHREMASPAQLQASRVEYEPFSSKVFSDRIRQEHKRNKFFYYLQLKRDALRNKKSTNDTAIQEIEDERLAQLAADNME